MAYAVLPGTRDFSALVHATSMRQAVRELEAARFVGVEVYANDDRHRVSGEDTGTNSWLYYVARTDGAPAPA